MEIIIIKKNLIISFTCHPNNPLRRATTGGVFWQAGFVLKIKEARVNKQGIPKVCYNNLRGGYILSKNVLVYMGTPESCIWDVEGALKVHEEMQFS